MITGLWTTLHWQAEKWKQQIQNNMLTSNRVWTHFLVLYPRQRRWTVLAQMFKCLRRTRLKHNNTVQNKSQKKHRCSWMIIFNSVIDSWVADNAIIVNMIALKLQDATIKTRQTSVVQYKDNALTFIMDVIRSKRKWTKRSKTQSACTFQCKFQD